MKLINVDDIKWQKGVFVNPMTDEPLPVVHKMATIEMLRDWQEEIKAIPLTKIEKVREEIQKLRGCSCSCSDGIIDDVEDILDKLIEESEEK